MKQDNLLIYVKNAELGKVKTRLAATLGQNKALLIYKNLLHHTKNICDTIAVQKTVCYAAYINNSDLWDKATYEKRLQIEGNLGEKMLHDFEISFQKKFKKVIIIGSDCPNISKTIINIAFNELEQHDVVLGPAQDGGYYLLGTKYLIPEIFINKSWSSPSLLDETLNSLNKLNIHAYLLPILSDIDIETDLINFPDLLQNGDY